MDRLAAMEAFVRVIDTGSFSAAARQLRIGQPAVSKTIAQLEERLGVRLLLRSTRGLTPTEAGQNFYERARRSIEEADEAELAARGAGAALSGRLRISAAVTFARLHVVPHLGGFLAQHPQLEIDIVLDDHPIDLVGQGIDVALRIGGLADSILTARRIGGSPRHVMGTPAYFAAAGTPARPQDLVQHDAVIHLAGGGEDWTFSRGSDQETVALRGRVRSTAAEAVREAVLAGLGLAVASDWMFAPELAAGTVVPAMTDWMLPPLALWAVFPTGRRASAKARAFADFAAGLMAARGLTAETA